MRDKLNKSDKIYTLGSVTGFTPTPATFAYFIQIVFVFVLLRKGQKATKDIIITLHFFPASQPFDFSKKKMKMKMKSQINTKSQINNK